MPDRPLAPILIFVDETYLNGRSGFLQAAFPVPRNLYDSTILPRSRELLLRLGKDAKEFKGSAIAQGNAKVYREFLRLFADLIADIVSQAPVYPVVSIDATSHYEGDEFEYVRFNVAGALRNLNITNAEKLASEFSRQMLWAYWHLPVIFPRGCANEFVLTFDAKYLHAEESRRRRFFSGGRMTAAAVSTLESAFTSCARTLLSDRQSKLRLPKIGHIGRFRFSRSEDEFGLQVADVLCHLVYSALRSAIGIADTGTAFKVALLEEVVPAFQVDSELRSKLIVAANPDGRPDVGVTDQQLRSRFQLAPLDDSKDRTPEAPVS